MRLQSARSLVVLATLMTPTLRIPVPGAPGQPSAHATGNRLRTAEVRDRPTQGCPVTQAPADRFVPPAPYASRPPGDQMFWFGTKRLWTILPADGTWRGLRPYSPTGRGFRQKIFWWREGYFWLADPNPELTVRARRLDAPAPPFTIPHATNGYTEKDFKSF